MGALHAVRGCACKVLTEADECIKLKKPVYPYKAVEY
jgi:hypothetical protein